MHSMHVRKYRNFITGYLIADVLFVGVRKSVFGAKFIVYGDLVKKSKQHRNIKRLAI